MTEPTTMRVKAIEHGTVIDHIPPAVTLAVVELLAGPEDEVLVGINFTSRHMGRKGVVKITGRELSPASTSRLALVAPQATMSIIRDFQVVSKGPVPIPPLFSGIGRCPNPNCVTNHEPCTTRFQVVSPSPLRIRCTYCERTFPGSEVALLPAT